MHRLVVALGLLTGLAAGPLGAQEQKLVVRSPVVTIDQERLFNESAYGKAILAGLEAEGASLAAENREIEDQLVAEERALTSERAGMDPAEFRKRAMAFDERVVSIRAEQDEKARALGRRRDTAQANFYQTILPVLTQIVRERGAVVVLESRAVILSAEQIDITGDAIERIDTLTVQQSTEGGDAPLLPGGLAPPSDPAENGDETTPQQ
ncbi:MAG: outer membrane chaperone Skp [Confluentimicrobium sp.]|uniref:OmpH family outer membrane protein n=1 Tax=Actibacterium sp. TaxID=1872125 RepID=UPI000C4B0946|nr:OmpH family outer membrane protein [Actibacterium sp.]MBC57720.1 outer membrane chaperone Skp [Actibacterium sp.]|tara:strand:+ start:597 stop:1223 length:627 start_codon:yes stop_codon:yes gene_type:complete